MALQLVLSEIRNVISSLYSVIVQEVSSQKYGKQTMFILVLIIALGSIFSGRRLLVQSRERAASKDFSHYLQEYRQAQAAESPDWGRLAMLFKMGYDAHSNSSLAPFFLMLQADILMRQNQKEQAIKVMDDALENMKTDHALFNVYATKSALAKLDSDDEVTRKQGLRALVTLANDTTNRQQDLAQYYIGLYHWNKDDIEVAKKAWKQLINSQSAEKQGKSPWAVQAQTLLQQTS